MTFVIDTGAPGIPTAVDLVADWLRDQCPADYTPAQIVQAYAHHLMGHMSPDRGDPRRPVRLSTIRDHFMANRRFVWAVAEEQPELFDEILVAYAERVLGG